MVFVTLKNYKMSKEYKLTDEYQKGYADGLEDYNNLIKQIVRDNPNWQELGKKMNEMFSEDDEK